MKRLNANPLLEPADITPTREDFEVVATFNPAAVRVGNETILLVRVAERPIAEGDEVPVAVHDAEAGRMKIIRIDRSESVADTSDPRLVGYKGQTLLTSISHIRVARSSDGVNFTFDANPAIAPTTPYEAYGCEDARVTCIDGRYYVSYSAVSGWGVTVALAATDDFRTFRRLGIIFPPYNKDVCIFPEKVGGMYVCRHRPFKSKFNQACIWTAYSSDLVSWGRHAMTMEPLAGTWQSERVGCGGTPIRTEAGWLEIFHASDDDGRYCLGAMLSDLEQPERLLHRSSRPVLLAETDYERTGLYGDCVFSNGLIERPDGTLRVYYGAGDSVCAAAETTVEEMIAAAKR